MLNSRYRILIVDDAEAIARRIELLFAEHRDKISTISLAESYEQAVKMMKQKAYHLVLLDIQLKDKNGMELLQHIKERYPETMTIMFTNNASPLYRNACLQLGADGFLDKTSDFEYLTHVVLKALSQVQQ